MNIQSLNIKVCNCAVHTTRGNRIFTYSKNKMQPEYGAALTGLDAQQDRTERLHMWPDGESASGVVQFHRETLVELVGLESRS
jgi:hypothetical protein